MRPSASSACLVCWGHVHPSAPLCWQNPCAPRRRRGPAKEGLRSSRLNGRFSTKRVDSQEDEGYERRPPGSPSRPSRHFHALLLRGGARKRPKTSTKRSRKRRPPQLTPERADSQEDERHGQRPLGSPSRPPRRFQCAPSPAAEPAPLRRGRRGARSKGGRGREGETRGEDEAHSKIRARVSTGRRRGTHQDPCARAPFEAPSPALARSALAERADKEGGDRGRRHIGPSSGNLEDTLTAASRRSERSIWRSD